MQCEYMRCFNDRSEEFVIYGELAKWVPVSPQRVPRIATVQRWEQTDYIADVEVHLRGQPYEHVTFTVGRRHGPPVNIDCVMSREGAGRLSVARETCQPVWRRIVTARFDEFESAGNVNSHVTRVDGRQSWTTFQRPIHFLQHARHYEHSTIHARRRARSRRVLRHENRFVRTFDAGSWFWTGTNHVIYCKIMLHINRTNVLLLPDASILSNVDRPITFSRTFSFADVC